MAISDKEVKKIASLARLQLSEEEVKQFSKELSQTIELVEKLNELNLDGVEATSHAVSLCNVFREDEMKISSIGEKVFVAAPDQEDNLFKVPRVI